MRAAVVVVDMQKGFFEHDYASIPNADIVRARVARNISRVLKAAREEHVPVVLVVTSYAEDGADWTLRMGDLRMPVCIRGTQDEQIVEELDVDPEDSIVPKTRYSAFFNTRLEPLLTDLGVKALVICGINTHACIYVTVVDAFMRDYRVYLPLPCIASYDARRHEASVGYLKNRLAMTVSLADVLRRIKTGDWAFRFQPR